MPRPRRLVYVSSELHRGGDAGLEDLLWERRPWNGHRAYSDTKLHDVLLAFAVARRWPGTLSNALEPGWVPTKLGGPRATGDLDAAHRTQAWLAASDDPAAAVSGARCVVTDTWLSMRDDPNEDRHALLMPYQVNEALMRLAAPDAVFMHCLPAHRGEEVTDAVIDGPQSVVWDGAENRLHAQKGILAWSLGAAR